MKKNKVIFLLVLSALLLFVIPPLADAWTAGGTEVCTAENWQGNPVICSDKAGGAVIAWYDQRDGSNYDIYAQRVDSSGNPLWGDNGMLICNAFNDQWANLHLVICSDLYGGAIIAWDDYRTVSECNIYAQRINETGHVKWIENGIPICTEAYDQFRVQIVSDGSGGAILTWQDFRDGTSFSDIFAQRVNSDGDVVSGWTVNGTAISQAFHSQDKPQLCATGDGAIITWEDYRYDSSYPVIFAQRVTNAGSVVWPAGDVNICNATYSQYDPQICTDGTYAYIAWYDDRYYTTYWYDIFVQKVNFAGTVQWTTDGEVVCIHDGYNYELQIIADGTGGAILVWRDGRTGDWDIYGQRVNSSGIPQWDDNGMGICTAGDGQLGPQICIDGGGGYFITWYDYRDISTYDIFAQRIDIDGNDQWEIGGRAICSAESNQENPQIVNTGIGKAIATWDDERGSDQDIYALLIPFSGGDPSNGGIPFGNSFLILSTLSIFCIIIIIHRQISRKSLL